MKRFVLFIIPILVFAADASAAPRRGGHRSGGRGMSGGEISFRSTSTVNRSMAPSQRRVSSVYSPDNPDYIARDDAAKKQFMVESGYPNGRDGYRVMFVIPLRDGGVDAPKNMRWRKVPGLKKEVKEDKSSS